MPLKTRPAAQAVKAEPTAPLDPVAQRRAAELAELKEIEAEEANRRAEEARRNSEHVARHQQAVAERDNANLYRSAPQSPSPVDVASRRRREADEMAPRRPAPRREGAGRRQSGKMTITQALSGDDNRRQRSLASVKRQREKARMREDQPQVKQVRDVVVPDNITVGELANRMAERTADVVKELMKLGIMATATQTIDGETAELVAGEFGHRVQRVSESDIEIGLSGSDDDPASLQNPVHLLSLSWDMLTMVKPACLMPFGVPMLRLANQVASPSISVLIKSKLRLAM
ncbi:MAG: hypothetical protein CM15mP46_0940 [Alphaproteobacteria bacterium]|nr:MAG: hypothetical protein CM15mP46_0940 [Alphaproteobacteria bacterium]